MCRGEQVLAVLNLEGTCVAFASFAEMEAQGFQEGHLQDMLARPAGLPKQDLYKLDRFRRWVKLRPGVPDLLRALQAAGFEICIHSGFTRFDVFAVC